MWQCLVGGCRSQSCHGYLRALLKACGSRLVASPATSAHFIRHHPQAHLMAMSLICISVWLHRWCLCLHFFWKDNIDKFLWIHSFFYLQLNPLVRILNFHDNSAYQNATTAIIFFLVWLCSISPFCLQPMLLYSGTLQMFIIILFNPLSSQFCNWAPGFSMLIQCPFV